MLGFRYRNTSKKEKNQLGYSPSQSQAIENSKPHPSVRRNSLEMGLIH